MPFGPFSASAWTSGRRETTSTASSLHLHFGLAPLPLPFAFYTQCRVAAGSDMILLYGSIRPLPCSLINFLCHYHPHTDLSWPCGEDQTIAPTTTISETSRNQINLGLRTFAHIIIISTSSPIPNWSSSILRHTSPHQIGSTHQIESTPLVAHWRSSKGLFFVSLVWSFLFHSIVYLSIRLLFSPGRGRWY